MTHPFENPPRPGSASGVAGVGWYGSNVPNKSYKVNRYSAEGFIQFGIRQAGQAHLDECERQCRRIRSGIEFLQQRPAALEAFVQIADPKVRRKIVDLVRSLAGDKED